jgi:MSHA biogenesis protein MshQ
MRFCLTLMLLLCALEASAAVGIDGRNFPNGIQSHSASGVIEFGWQGVLETNNRQLRAGSIVQNTSQSPATCGSLGFCQAVSPPAPTQDPGSFPSTDGTQDVTLGYQQTGILNANGSNQYDRIRVGQEATLTINSGGQAFYIDRLDLDYRAALVLGSGDYWIDDLNFDGSEVRVFIPAGNQVRLFVNSAETVSFRTLLNYRDLNTPGTPDQLFIYAYNNFSIDNQVETPAYIYSRADFRLGNSATLRGAVTARNVTLESSNARVIFATPPTQTLSCFNDSFGRSSLGSEWVTTRRSGSFAPGIVGNSRLRLTNDTNNVATAVTLQRLFPAASNLVEIEFNYYAFSNSGSRGADGVAVILSDSAYTPQPGSFGGSLGYAQRDNGDTGFAGGWLGIGLDEYGNFSQANEGRVGGIGFRPDGIAIRGSYPNYRYLRGTGTLSPEVDSSTSTTTPSPNHRYRIRIDSRLAGQALVSVERNSGSGFQSLVAPFNALTQTGQVAIPSNFWLSFTGSTGGSVNNHDLDDLQVCALRMNPVGVQIDHIRVEHDGSALTCQPEGVTVKACMDADCTSTYPDPLTVTLSPSAGWVGGNSLALTGGVGTTQYRRTVVGDVTFGVTGVSAPLKPFSTPKCANGGPLSSCPLSFAESGFIFDVPNMVANTEQTVSLQAVRKSDTSQLCVPAFESGTRKIKFWSGYDNPNSGTRSVAIGGVSIAGASPGTDIDLTFGPQARASFTLRYADAGLMTLNARYAPTSGDESGLVMTGTDSFISRPAGLCVYSDTPNSDCAAGDASCSTFVAAGDPFRLRVGGVAWEKDADDDLCSGNLRTPNYRQVGLPAQPAITLIPTLIAPGGGSPGALGVVGLDIAASDAGEKIVTDQRISEVGVFTVTATPPSSYLSIPGGAPGPGVGDSDGDGDVDILSTSAYIGRFFPALFQFEDPQLTPACNNSTYAGLAPQLGPPAQPLKRGQSFGFAGTLLARNRAGGITRNYIGDFAKLTGGDFVYSDAGGVGTVITEGTVLTLPGAQGDGYVDYRAETPSFQFGSPREPYALPIRSSATDSDGVTGSVIDIAMPMPDFRLGQARIANAHGSELLGLPLPFSVAFFNGSGYAPNPLDSCTVFKPAVLEPYQPADTGSGQPALADLPYQVSVGLGEYLLSAPGADSGGSQWVRFTPAPDWLKYDWDGNGSLDDPRGLATFGIFKGSAPLIYRREIYRQ